MFQIFVSSLLVAGILIQQRGSALGSDFGYEGGFYATRRGIQKKIFWSTVTLGGIFILLSVLNLVI
jgi:protein translocase SecG subunit